MYSTFSPSTSTVSSTNFINVGSKMSVIVGFSNAFSAPFVIVIVYCKFPLAQFCLSAVFTIVNPDINSVMTASEVRTVGILSYVPVTLAVLLNFVSAVSSHLPINIICILCNLVILEIKKD